MNNTIIQLMSQSQFLNHSYIELFILLRKNAFEKFV